jgi:hypothetical protein
MSRQDIHKDAVKFTKDDPRINRAGRVPGSKNRSTILKKWIEINAKIENPETGELEAGTMEDRIALALLMKAREGDVQAIKEIFDTLYGKLTDKTEVKAEGIQVIFENASKNKDD